MFQFLKRKYTNLVYDTRFSEILTGSAWAFSGQVMARALGLLFSILVARLYGAEIVGIIAIVLSCLRLTTMLTVLGTNTSILRMVPEHLVKYSPTSAFWIYRKTQYLIIGVSLVTGTLLFFASDLIADKIFFSPQLSFYFRLTACFVVFHSMAILNTQAVRGLKLVKIFAVMQALPESCSLICLGIFALLWPTSDVPIYARLCAFAMTGIIGWLIMEDAFRKKRRPGDSVYAVSLRQILSLSAPMMITTIMMSLAAEIGVIMLGIFRTESEVGYYSIAVKLGTLVGFILKAINSVAASKFSELFHSKKMDELFYIAQKSAKLIFYTTAPILIGFLVFGKFILGIVGPGFETAYTALVLLVFGQFVNSVSGSSGMFMNMTGHQTTLRNIMVIAAVLNIILNLFLIPYAGINGAALVAMISVCFWNITTLVYIKIKFGKTTGYFPLLTH